jgi:hypothetical protein
MDVSQEKPKPLLVAALTCERILHEADGILSVMRLVDRFTAIVPAATPEVISIPLRFWVLVAFRSGGETEGHYAISLVLRPPTGVDATAQVGDVMPIDLQGGSHGVSLSVEMNMAVRQPGLYWIDVLVDGERMTSMPVTVTLQRVAGPEPRAPSSSSQT